MSLPATGSDMNLSQTREHDAHPNRISSGIGCFLAREAPPPACFHHSFMRPLHLPATHTSPCPWKLGVFAGAKQPSAIGPHSLSSWPCRHTAVAGRIYCFRVASVSFFYYLTRLRSPEATAVRATDSLTTVWKATRRPTYRLIQSCQILPCNQQELRQLTTTIFQRELVWKPTLFLSLLLSSGRLFLGHSTLSSAPPLRPARLPTQPIRRRVVVLPQPTLAPYIYTLCKYPPAFLSRPFLPPTRVPHLSSQSCTIALEALRDKRQALRPLSTASSFFCQQVSYCNTPFISSLYHIFLYPKLVWIHVVLLPLDISIRTQLLSFQK
jgi:hypothetical protein